MATRKTRPVKVPKQTKLPQPTKQEALYRKRLLAVVKAMVARTVEALRPLLGAAADEVAQETPDAATPTRTDAAAMELVFQALGEMQVAFLEALPAVQRELDLDGIAESVDQLGKDDLKRRMARIARVNPVIAEPWLAPQIGLFRQANVELIKSASQDFMSKVNGIVSRGFQAGTRPEDMISSIMGAGDVSASRARLIARDQVSKLYGQLNKLRQTQLGLDRYTWRASNDERVRTMHADLDGQVFSWDDPPVTNSAGDRNHPGGDYQCRCTAEPYLADLLAED